MVRFSVSAATTPKNSEERYWQTAPTLELATADRDWKGAHQHLIELLGIEVAGWFRETTAANLERQQEAFGGDTNALHEIQKIAAALKA